QNLYVPDSAGGKPQPAVVLREVKDLKEVLANSAHDLLDLTEGGWCAISLQTRYVVSLETNLSRREGSEEIIKVNPRTVLGGRFERGKRYAVTHNPETNSSILLSCDEEHVAKLEMLFREAGFRVGRVCCGTYALLRHALAAVNSSKDGAQPASAFLVVFCEGAVCALVQQDDKWLELRSRTDVYEPEEISPALDLLAPFQARIPAEMPVVAVADTLIPGLSEKLGAVFHGHAIQDLSSPELLANLLVQY
ncbi:MAG: hypothetical protein N2322_06450, partial [Terrimicrobiaceae bacterium]|nr:hypothetical protein [Terrimicrobiaceae bacterium]